MCRYLSALREALNPSVLVLFTQRQLKGPVHMCIRRAHFGVMAAAMLLAGCSFVSSTVDPVWSALSVERSSPISIIDGEGSGSTNITDRRPLVTIRFYRSKVPYEKALFTAVSLALERRSDVMFDLVAVTPQLADPLQIAVHSDASRRNAENVFRSLTGMGLPPERVSLSATTSANVQSEEVQLYVR